MSHGASRRPNEPVGDFVLTLACPDRPGIVHAVTAFLMRHGGNIMESQQFGDQQSGRFFMRIDFEVDAPHRSADTLRDGLRRRPPPSSSMDFELWAATAPYRTLIMVSKHLHCLNDLLFRHSTGACRSRCAVVVSNHLGRRAPGEVPRPRLPPRPGHPGDQGRGGGRS